MPENQVNQAAAEFTAVRARGTTGSAGGFVDTRPPRLYSGKYAYTESSIVLTPGMFYWNPKDHPHGPTQALEDSLLIEIYDGPHYYERPDFHGGSGRHGAE